MSSSPSGSDPNKKNLSATDKPENKKRKKEKEEKKPQVVKKVSPVARFFSSMKVKFTSIIITYTLLSVVVGCVLALVACLNLYEWTDVLNMQEMVQSVVGGIQVTSNGLILRGGLGAKQIGSAIRGNISVLNNTAETEEKLARHIHDNMAATMDGPGLYAWNFMPMHLFMLWDENWNERLIYYRPCKDAKNRTVCELMSRESPFVDYAGGNYTIGNKDAVPDFFRRIKDVKPTKCQAYGDCVGIANIPNDQGGPMMYFLSRLAPITQIPEELHGWHMLWSSNMLFFNQIAANRTGLCFAGYSSNESGIPSKVAQEYEKKKHQALYGFVNPHDSYYNMTISAATFFQDTDNVTLAQDFYSSTRYDTPDRLFCDDSYDHGVEHPRSKSNVFLAYSFFDYASGKLLDDTYMLRIDYHNPISQRSFSPVAAIIITFSALWFATICGLVIYFNCSFLVPLEKMRKMRSDLIKTSLAGLDDDGTLAQEIFGSMVDDNALIDANGDEIRVMLTLQERLNGFYTGLIGSRSDDLAHIKAHYQRRYNALKVMNYFMRRDNDDLKKSLPGLLDSKEITRHFRHNAAASNVGAGAFMQGLANARHTFRQFKTILGNELAIEFFKSFCVQRGRNTVNSLFFVMDVSWLNQVEEGAKKGSDDFLSTLFSDALSRTSNPPSPHTGRQRGDLVISTSSLSSLGDSDSVTSRGELISPRNEANRPRHSHFGKAKEAGNSKKTSETDSVPDAPAVKKKKVPFASSNDARKQGASSSELVLPAGEEKKVAQAGPPFASAYGENISRFIYESYFGRKSLAQRDMKHASLLGCSQVSDYLTLRDGGASVVYSPVMFNNLLAAVIKKFSNDVIPEFLDSSVFQVFVYCLILINYFAKSSNKRKRQRSEDDEVIEKKSNALIKAMREACRVTKQEEDDEDGDDDDDDDDSSSTSSDGSDDEAEEKEKKEEKKEEKNDEGKGDKQ